MNFLFWNVGHRAAPQIIAHIARENDADVLVMAEASSEFPGLSEALADVVPDGSSPYRQHGPQRPSRLVLWSRLPDGRVRCLTQGSRHDIWLVQMDSGQDLILVTAHLASKLHWSETSQGLQCIELASSIRAAEDLCGHQRAVLVGDLNADPFEFGVVGATGLHAMMDRSIAANTERTVDGAKHRFFYNPMWNHYGDERWPPGTYYYGDSQMVTQFWHLFDQVLVRPALLPMLRPDGVRVLTRAGKMALTDDNGRPHPRVSDHFPLWFCIDDGGATS